MIKHGQKVRLEYSVFLEDGTQIDTNVGEDPLVFVLGAHRISRSKTSTYGLADRRNKEILLPPEEAYGPVVPDAYREVDFDAVPEAYRFEGAVLGIQDPQGGVFPIRVHKINDKKIVLDFNHPLAGRSLRFEVKVVGVD